MQKTQKRKTKKIQQENAIISAARSGASAHAIAGHFQITMDEANAYVNFVANEVKQSGFSHRVNLRHLLREQISAAVGVVREVMKDERKEEGYNLFDKDYALRATIRLKAADIMLKHASKFVDEDVMTGFVEQPDIQVQQTLFDFVSEIDETGSVHLFAKEHKLRLIESE